MEINFRTVICQMSVISAICYNGFVTSQQNSYDICVSEDCFVHTYKMSKLLLRIRLQIVCLKNDLFMWPGKSTHSDDRRNSFKDSKKQRKKGKKISGI
jgi:hypothetical protein